MLILDIQFWSGDKAQAMELARLIADLEPKPRNDVAVLFAARWDTTHDQATVDYVKQKFPVFTFTTRVKATGWPNGCNRLMSESYQHCIELVRDGKVDAKAVLFIESDAIPLHPDWINKLIQEYRLCDKMVLGAWLKKGDCPVEHVNGNCIMSLDFWKPYRAILNPPAQGGWDATCARFILPNAAPSRLIWSDYHLGKPANPWKGCDFLWEPKRYGAPDNPLYGEDLYPVWLHGPKDRRGIECVRAKFLAE